MYTSQDGDSENLLCSVSWPIYGASLAQVAQLFQSYIDRVGQVTPKKISYFAHITYWKGNTTDLFITYKRSIFLSVNPYSNGNNQYEHNE